GYRARSASPSHSGRAGNPTRPTDLNTVGPGSLTDPSPLTQVRGRRIASSGAPLSGSGGNLAREPHGRRRSLTVPEQRSNTGSSGRLWLEGVRCRKRIRRSFAAL